ncbi:MAG: hypothetical protein ACYTF4_15880 [Planctomycetota bacterium]|jgi:hypothetical protein
MSTGETAQPESLNPRLTPVDAVHLLEVGVTGPLRSVDRVVERLQHRDSEKWFKHALTVAAQITGHDVARLPEDAPSPDDLVLMKDRAKAARADAPTVDLALCATLTYLVCLGAALAHHGRRITSRPRAELDRVFVDLADAVPPPWQEMLLKAALTTSEPG